MNYNQTLKLLSLVKANWYQQPVDEITIQGWQLILGDLELVDCNPALLRFIREEHRPAPPTPGELYAYALPEYRARKVRENEELLRLPGEQGRGYLPGERRVTPAGRVYVADENGILRPGKEVPAGPESGDGVQNRVTDIAALVKLVGKPMDGGSRE